VHLIDGVGPPARRRDAPLKRNIGLDSRSDDWWLLCKRLSQRPRCATEPSLRNPPLRINHNPRPLSRRPGVSCDWCRTTSPQSLPLSKRRCQQCLHGGGALEPPELRISSTGSARESVD
jgi:hypothetical protein